MLNLMKSQPFSNNNFPASHRSWTRKVGTILSVGDGIARVYSITNAKAGELVEFETGVQAIVLNLEKTTWCRAFRTLTTLKGRV